MDYTSLNEKLIMPEYGRNIQHMVAHALTLPTREERNRCAEVIVRAMIQLHPELNSDEKRHTFYDHLAIMSDFKLDIDYPYGQPVRENMSRKPELLQYSQPCFPQRHYGKLIQEMIRAASQEEDMQKRQELIIRIGNRMKYTYLVWNRNQVDDEQIIHDIERLSGGLLDCRFPEFQLLPAQRLMPSEHTASQQKKKKKKK